jgi:hypothetical protein
MNELLLDNNNLSPRGRDITRVAPDPDDEGLGDPTDEGLGDPDDSDLDNGLGDPY